MYSFGEYYKVLQEREYERYLEEYPIYLNPTNDELRSLLPNRDESVRGILDKNGNVYIWDERAATHKRISIDLSIPIYVGFYVFMKPDKSVYVSSSSGMYYETDQRILKNNKNIQRMLLGFTVANHYQSV